MYLCYVDESGDPGRHGSRLLILGAAAVFEGQWRTIREDFDRLLETYFSEPARRPAEVHFAHLRLGKKEFARLSRTQRMSLAEEACDIAARLMESELRFFTVIADKRDWFARNPNADGDDLYAELFEDVSGRFDLYLRRRYAQGAPSKGIIIADPHKPALSKVIQKNHGVFQRTGNRWGRVRNLIETVFFLPSHESPGLQLADLCTYAVHRALEFGAQTLLSRVKSVFDREPLNSTKDPGKWHGVKYVGNDAAIRKTVEEIWG